jgi:hypothetical protein
VRLQARIARICSAAFAHALDAANSSLPSRSRSRSLRYDREIGSAAGPSAPPEGSLFHGTNYVFDNRQGRAITDHKLGDCVTCGAKTGLVANCNNDACHKRIVQCDACGGPSGAYRGCCGDPCRTLFERRFSPRADAPAAFDPAVFDDAQGYSESHTSTPSRAALFREILDNTRKLMPTGAHMCSAGVQGRLLATFAGMARGGRVLEIGTFTG